ncbi:hypothetical protein Acr_12g0000120 [Actinidia rufa]|uniref:Uncharacterized protein n=1 Tax=Actinidia rufa TaxID=165716 RepID=A0A7J0FFL7_9ERIC|nr:hypothetical protein Acr_12g0000120 [Actinidia rufa]
MVKLDLISNTLQPREFYSVKNILRSKAFLRCFAITSQAMASNGGDNAEEKNVGDVPHITADKGESRRFQDDLTELEEAHPFEKGERRSQNEGSAPNPGKRDIHWREVVEEGPRWYCRHLPVEKKLQHRLMSRKKGPYLSPRIRRKVPAMSDVKPTSSSVRMMPQDIPHFLIFREGTSINPRATFGHEASMVNNFVMAQKLSKASCCPPTRRWQKVVAGLKKYKDNSNVIVEKFKKKMAKLKMREIIAKKLAIDDFKASEEYKETVKGAASSYFGETFDQCKKQINLLFSDLDVNDRQMDPYLVDGDEEEDAT